MLQRSTTESSLVCWLVGWSSGVSGSWLYSDASVSYTSWRTTSRCTAMAGEGFSDDFWPYQAEHREKLSWLAARGHGYYPKFKQLCHLLIRDTWWIASKMARNLEDDAGSVRSTDRRWDLNPLKMGDKYGDRVRRFLVVAVGIYIDLGTRPRQTISDHLSYIDALLHVSPAVSDTSNLSVDPGILQAFSWHINITL